MHEVWSQELQCYRTRNASLVGLKYTCFYLCLVRIVSGLIFRIFTAEIKPNVSLADIRRCCPFTQGHSGVFRFLVVFILRFVKTGNPTPLSSNIRSDPEPKAKLDGYLFKFFVEQFGNPFDTSK